MYDTIGPFVRRRAQPADHHYYDDDSSNTIWYDDDGTGGDDGGASCKIDKDDVVIDLAGVLFSSDSMLRISKHPNS